jgi:hypothetical protein
MSGVAIRNPKLLQSLLPQREKGETRGKGGHAGHYIHGTDQHTTVCPGSCVKQLIFCVGFSQGRYQDAAKCNMKSKRASFASFGGGVIESKRGRAEHARVDHGRTLWGRAFHQRGRAGHARGTG